MAIPYISGFSVKPFSVSALGVLTFTSGNDSEGTPITVIPNQLQCEAYGYTYNIASGTCSTFRYNTNLERSFANANNNTKGAGNTTETGTNNTCIMGENNTVKGFSRNNIIVGSNTVDSYFVIPDNTAMYFHADIIGLRTGGTSASGAVGDYGSWVERGVVINKSGTLSINRERDTIKSSGDTTGWRPLAAVSGTNFLIGVKGASDMTVEWASTIRFTQIKSGVTL